VNSSLNAVPIYERFGFVIEAPKVERYGGAYAPMILKLAASNGCDKAEFGGEHGGSGV